MAGGEPKKSKFEVQDCVDSYSINKQNGSSSAASACHPCGAINILDSYADGFKNRVTPERK